MNGSTTADEADPEKLHRSATAKPEQAAAFSPVALTRAERAGSSLQRLELDGRLAVLRGLYWQLRYLRRGDSAGRRRLYRAIRREREKFDGTAIDVELLRLFCRVLACPGNWHAERRYLMRLAWLAEEASAGSSSAYNL